jgi:hypothetical protein
MLKVINEIIDECSNNEVKLVNVLTKSQVLAYNLNKKKFKNWIECELNGYPENIRLPKYRTMQAAPFGTIEYETSKKINVLIPHSHLPKEIKLMLTSVKVGNSITSIEEAILVGMNGRLEKEFFPKYCEFLGLGLPGNPNIHSVWIVIDRNGLAQLVSAVRSKLLELLFKLKDEIGVENDQAKIQLLNSTQHNSNFLNNSSIGNNTTIIVGNNNQLNLKIGE